jgi:cytochrome P450
MRRLSMREMNAFQADQTGFIQKMIAEQGNVVVLKMMWMRFIILAEPDVVGEFLIKHADQVERDPFVSPIFKRIFGEGVFVAEGARWKRKRKLVSPAFRVKRVRDYAGTMAAYTRDMLDGWSGGDVVAIDAQLTQLTLRIIAKTMYDVDLEGEVETIGRTMKSLLSIVEAQLRSPMSAPAWVPTPTNLRQRRLYGELRELLLGIIARRRASGEDAGDLLSMLLQVEDEDGAPMGDDELLDECMTLFVAGHETTAAALTWTWYLLGRHAEARERVYEEVDRVLGGEPVTAQDVEQMPYLEAVIKESMRLYPPAYGFARTVTEPFELAGYAFEEKTIVMVSTYAMHRRADLYPEPEAFRPERFLEGEPPGRHAYLPFGAGRRICLGSAFAMLEAAVILATMIQRVRLEPVDEAPAVEDTLVTLRPRDPVRMTVTTR